MHEYKECDEALILCVVCGAMGNKMRPLKFDNKQYYFRNIFKNIPINKIFKVSLIKIVKLTY